MTNLHEKHCLTKLLNQSTPPKTTENILPNKDVTYAAFADTLSSDCCVDASEQVCTGALEISSIVSSTNHGLERALNSVLSTPTLKGDFLSDIEWFAARGLLDGSKFDLNREHDEKECPKAVLSSLDTPEEPNTKPNDGTVIMLKSDVHPACKEDTDQPILTKHNADDVRNLLAAQQNSSKPPMRSINDNRNRSLRNKIIDNSNIDYALKEDSDDVNPTIEVTKGILNEVRAYAARRKRISEAETPAFLPLPRGVSESAAREIKAVNNVADVVASAGRTHAARLDSAELALGHIVAGRYEILSEIARGGFGVVYRARQIGIDRIVALKRLKSQNEPDVVERFLLEANIIKNLIHPNTIQLIDAGNDEENHLYIVMEYVEGRSLQAVLSTGEGINLPRALCITIQILKSLNEAHQRGIIHRDLKPSNILLRNVIGEHDFVKVLDFGIAKQNNALIRKLTLDGKILGTPQYIAPELYAGHAPTAASDIYAIGLILAHMLIGKSLVPNNAVDAVKWHLSEDVSKLPDWLNDTEIGAVIRKAICKEPENRYHNAEEMIFDLRRIEQIQHCEASVMSLKGQKASKMKNAVRCVIILFMLSIIAALLILLLR